MTKQVMQQALEALRKAMQGNLDFDEALAAYEALREELAQQEEVKPLPDTEIPAEQVEFTTFKVAQQGEQPDDSDVNQVHAANAAVTYPSIHFSAPAAQPPQTEGEQVVYGCCSVIPCKSWCGKSICISNSLGV